jgi:hypothetical protein
VQQIAIVLLTLAGRIVCMQAPRVASIAAPVRGRSLVTYAVVSRAGEGANRRDCFGTLSLTALRPLRRPPLSQDKAAVLADVRSIISEQLGTELDKVTPRELDLLLLAAVGVLCSAARSLMFTP